MSSHIPSHIYFVLQADQERQLGELISAQKETVGLNQGADCQWEDQRVDF